MIRAVADTHAIVWYLFGDRRLSVVARTFIDDTITDGDQIAISSMTFVEIVFLVERGRVNQATFERLSELMANNSTVFVEIPVDQRSAQTMRQLDEAQVPDMPDRIIAATALHLGVPLITRDHKIQASSITTLC